MSDTEEMTITIASPEQVLYVSIADVHPSPDNPRTDLGDVTELANSIRSVGIIEPLIVTGMPDELPGYELVAGARRLAAAQQTDEDVVPVIVRDMDDTERRSAMLIENLMRKDLTPLEEAAGYGALRKVIQQKAIATTIGVSPAHISRRILLLDLPERARAQLESGDVINIHAAEELARLARRDKESAERTAIMPVSQWSWAAARAIQVLDGQDWITERTKELEAEGRRVVVDHEASRFLTIVARDQADPETFTADHEAYECHAIELHPMGRHEYVVCTDPSSHGVGAETSDEPEPMSRRELAHLASEARRPFYQGLIDRQSHEVTRQLIVDAVAFGIEIGYWDTSDEQVAEMLEVPLIVEGEEDDELQDPTEALNAHAGTSERAAFRVALTRTLLAIDREIRVGAEVAPKVLTAHDELLASAGYHPEVAA